MKTNENNQVVLIGRLEEDFEFSHVMYDEEFYRSKLKTTRLSGKEDIVPILVSGTKLCKIKPEKGETLHIEGEFRSYKYKNDDGSKHLGLNVLISKMNILGELSSKNEILINHAVVCKPPICRQTPLGRDITDLMVCVNRAYGKSDCIPCIAWNVNAIYASILNVGNEIQFEGRIQSRLYKKKYLDSNKEETKMAYEVSIDKLYRL